MKSVSEKKVEYTENNMTLVSYVRAVIEKTNKQRKKCEKNILRNVALYKGNEMIC